MTMLTTQDKQSALCELRRHISFLDGAQNGERRLEPVCGDQLAPAFFAHGLHEIVGETPADRAAAAAFALIAAGYGAKSKQALLFAAPDREGRETGWLYGAGLDRLGVDPASLVLVRAPSEKALLWTAEEAASCRALAAAIIVLGRHQKLYGFTASRRLKLRQEKSGTPLFIVRPRTGEASAATMRWRVMFAPTEGLRVPGSLVPLPGRPRFRVFLERYGGAAPLQWEVELDEAHALRVVAAVSDRPALTPRFNNQSAA
ncbi:MAG TPA: hypothetical protein VH858_07610 [Hyphomicrobiales bacterium]|jgi:protein ImuA